MGHLFGTDGIRGIAGKYPLTKDFVRKIGYVSSSVILSALKNFSTKPSILIGMDSRKSGDFIKNFLVEGMSSNNLQIYDLGIIPTPAVAYLTKKMNAAFGIVISASHNPPEFNGIKFFSSNGFKLNNGLERMIENRLINSGNFNFKSGKSSIQKIDFSRHYIDFIKSTIPQGISFSGCKIVVDCGNGAAYKIAPLIFKELGACVYTIGTNPNGKNINVGCGSLLPEKMARKTVANQAFCGMSFDGDADRVIFSDEKGRILDGDDLISIAAPYLLSNARLKNKRVVLTLMSNCALIKYLNSFGISVTQVPVGDKNVTDAMEKENLVLGGESSGHLIFREFAPTGDGILTAVQILSMVLAMKKPLSHFTTRWKKFPQFVCSVKTEQKPPLEKINGFIEKINYLEKRLKGNGRIFVRYSGTEPLLRILVEAESRVLTKKIAQDIIKHYKKHAVLPKINAG